jgi:DNA (cytosine-5)-methyltransferase 1
MKQCHQVAEYTNIKYEQSRRIYGMDGMCPTITTRASGGHEVKIMDNRPVVRIAEATIGDSINIAYPNSKTRRGRVCEGKANTLSTSPQQAVITEDSSMDKIRIRKLTPRECWRLMGFDDEDFDKARAVNSDTQLYKQAGNSIVVNVLEAIMGNMNLIEDRSAWLDALLAD